MLSHETQLQGKAPAVIGRVEADEAPELLLPDDQVLIEEGQLLLKKLKHQERWEGLPTTPGVQADEVLLAQMIERGNSSSDRLAKLGRFFGQASEDWDEATVNGIEHYTSEPNQVNTEFELAALGAEARAVFVKANLYLVGWLSRHSRPIGSLSQDDLSQEGFLGLNSAVDGFDWRRGNRFSSFAAPRILNAIIRARHTQASLVRAPRELSEELEAELRANGGDESDLDEELKQLLGKRRTVWLHQSVDKKGTEMIDTLPDEENPTPEMEAIAASVWEDLGISNRARIAVMLRCNQCTLQEIGDMMGMSKGKARALIDRTLKLIRESKAGSGLVADTL